MNARAMFLFTAAFCAALMSGCGTTPAGSTGSDAHTALAVDSIGSFFIGGHEVALSGLPSRSIVFSPGAPPATVDPNGTFEAGQMYVQYVKLAHPRTRLPVLLWHGGGLTGANWETTPDGRPGWQMFFLNAGYDVYVSDAVERGRSSWARYPEIYKTEPFFRSKAEAWKLFRIGPTYSDDRAKRVAFPGSQFPVEAFDTFSKQFVPRWATNDALTQAAYDALVQRVCPCILIAHSQGVNFALTAALHAPDKIKALVALEPSGAPNLDEHAIAALKQVPQLFVWGDNLDTSSFWRSVVDAPLRYQRTLVQAGATVDTLSLPAEGLHGNSHMMMMDRDSDQIAAKVAQWLARHAGDNQETAPETATH
ncbi:alpha/beta fold hydrolase [Paraburkholderia flava]|uniref:alpha/beta fold hydrolase n=1 Tax=Paraburkholderia flava TaxID=2547393 RepID=UPI00105B821E|nr:alpha/beta fold hydrolase [Paraburkholderia flava]